MGFDLIDPPEGMILYPDFTQEQKQELLTYLQWVDQKVGELVIVEGGQRLQNPIDYLLVGSFVFYKGWAPDHEPVSEYSDFDMLIVYPGDPVFSHPTQSKLVSNIFGHVVRVLKFQEGLVTDRNTNVKLLTSSEMLFDARMIGQPIAISLLNQFEIIKKPVEVEGQIVAEFWVLNPETGEEVRTEDYYGV